MEIISNFKKVWIEKMELLFDFRVLSAEKKKLFWSEIKSLLFYGWIVLSIVIKKIEQRNKKKINKFTKKHYNCLLWACVRSKLQPNRETACILILHFHKNIERNNHFLYHLNDNCRFVKTIFKTYLKEKRKTNFQWFLLFSSSTSTSAKKTEWLDT